jgi:hypothetical protein
MEKIKIFQTNQAISNKTPNHESKKKLPIPKKNRQKEKQSRTLTNQQNPISP